MQGPFETRLLQVAVAIGCMVPLAGGLDGILNASAMLAAIHDVTLDSHVRYLSGLLLAIGLGFLSTISAIARQGDRFTILTAIVVTGGLARLYGVLVDGAPGPIMMFALTMELVVTPLLWLWQRRIAAMQPSP